MEDKPIKLFTAAKELNIGTGTIVDFLATKGYKVQKHPTTLLNGDMYGALLKEFAVDKIITEEVKQISIGKIRKEEPAQFPEKPVEYRRSRDFENEEIRIIGIGNKPASISSMEDKPIKLFTAAKELCIGTGTFVDFLATKGYKVQKHPTALLDGDMYNALLKEFAVDKIIKEEAKQINIGKIRKDEPAQFPENPVEHRRSRDFENEEILVKEIGSYDNARPVDKSSISVSENKPLSPKEVALELILNCIKTKKHDLDLGNCGLTSKDFSAKTELDTQLRNCFHLTTLSFSNYYWIRENSTTPLRKVNGENKGRRNYLTEIPPAVKVLKNLTSFICCGNDDEDWEIKDILVLNNHTKLEYLDLSHNKIESIKDIKKLPSLKVAILHNNRIRFINNLLRLSSLRIADVHTNRIDTLFAIDKETKILSLDLHDNQIKELNAIERYVKLEQLFIHRNLIESINGFQGLLAKNDEFYLRADENPFVRDYQLKLLENENHFAFIKEILQRSLDKSDRINVTYPVKILVFGNHSVGKSTLVDFLTNRGGTGSTHILRIVNYDIEKKTHPLPDAIFFDFGGQDFYHGIYRAFVSENALQLILFNLATDVNQIDIDINKIPTINFNRNYWLGQKNYQEHGNRNISSYIIIQTYADLKENDVKDIKYSNYPGLLKAFDISLKTATDNETLADELAFYSIGRQYCQKYLNNVVKRMQVCNEEPKWYSDFLKYIMDRDSKSHKALSIDELLLHYNSQHEDVDERRQSLTTNLTQLHRFGLVLYYPDISGLQDIVWLNPQKLAEHIQNDLLSKTFMSQATNKNPGVIPKVELDQIITDDKIIMLLKAQNVIFLHDPYNDIDRQEYIVPNYLPLAKKGDLDLQLFSFGLEQPNFVIKFNDFIPFGFINQMICFFGKLPDVKKFWRNKLLFTLENEIRILIDLDFESLKIKINFQCLQRSQYSSTMIIEYLFFSILGLYWNIHVDWLFSFAEFVENRELEENDILINKIDIWRQLKNDPNYVPEDAYISLDDQHFVSYFDLVNLPDDSYAIDAYSIAQNKINHYKSRSILIGQFKPFTAKKLAIMKKIFVSYSKFDEDYLQDFEDHLITLKNEGVATFNCKKIEFGKEWDDEIKKQLDECDIMVCLISVKFLNTDYITKIEIPKAIEQKKLIIPIIIKSCDWENSPLGKYQAAQRGKIVALDNGKKLFGEIRAQTKEERDAFWTDVIKEFRAKINFN